MADAWSCFQNVMHAPCINSIMFWDALNWATPDKGTAWMESWTLRGLFVGGRKKLLLIDLVVSLALSLGPEHGELSLFCMSAFQENTKLVSYFSHSCTPNSHF